MTNSKLACVLCLCALGFSSAASAQVTRVDVLSREPLASNSPAGKAGPYEVIRGRIHGEVDPADRHNTIIQDLPLAPRNTRGRVEYVATFALAKPVDMTKASGVLVYQVVNRGNGAPVASAEGDISLVSGWQGDVVPTAANQTIVVPVARNGDGSPITGPVIARFFNMAAGTNTLPIRLSSIGGGPPAYPAATLDQPDATLARHTSETPSGVQRGSMRIPRQDWAFADCTRTPFPGTPDPTRLCVKDGYECAPLLLT